MITISLVSLVLFIIFIVAGIILGKKFFAPKQINEEHQFQN